MSGDDAKEKRAATVVLALGYVCVTGLLINVSARAGLLHFRLPGLTGSAARMGWLFGAALCFAVAWYLGRTARDRGRS